MLWHGKTCTVGGEGVRPSQILPIKRSAGFRDSRVDLVTLVDIQPCAQDIGMLQSAVGWLVLPIPVKPTELDCSPNELPLSSHPTGCQPSYGFVFSPSRPGKSVYQRENEISYLLTYRHRIRVTMSKQRSSPAKSLLMPTDIHKHGRMTADNLPQMSYQGDHRSPSDDGTETETMCVFGHLTAQQPGLIYAGRSGDGTIADPHSCVGEDGRTYQGYMPGGEEAEPCFMCSSLT